MYGSSMALNLSLIHICNTEAAKQLFDTAISRAYKDAMSQVAAMTEQDVYKRQEEEDADRAAVRGFFVLTCSGSPENAGGKGQCSA